MAKRSAPPVREPLVDVVEYQHDRDRGRRDEPRRGKELGRPEADGEPRADAENHREHVRDRRLAERVTEGRERRAADRPERGADGARRRHEERVDPARARRALPERERREDAQDLEAVHAESAHDSLHFRARRSARLATTSEPTTSMSVTSTSAT